MSDPDQARSLRILVAGIGNIFLGDDAFGSEVARRLLARPRPPGVKVVDFGIRGLDLTYSLMDGYDVVILIDACPRGQGEAGTLYVLEPTIEADDASQQLIDAHSMDPMKVLRAATAMGARPGRVLLVGCEPTPATSTAGDESADEPPDETGDAMRMDMSPAVSRAVDEAAALVESLVESLLHQVVSDRPLTARFPPPQSDPSAEMALPKEI